MKAIVLAAGVGRRLGSAAPKCLSTVGGRRLVDRTLDALDREAAVGEAVFVVGHEADAVRDAALREPRRLRVSFVLNHDYRRGSVVSLACAAGHLDGRILVMDADVLFHPMLLSRLVHSQHEDCYLLDGRAVPSGEEMMVAVSGGRVRRVTRQPGRGWPHLGETLGFTKLGPVSARRLAEILHDMLERGERDADYEVALDRLLSERPAGWVDASDLPWTEIDFPEDLARAEAEVLPAMAP